MAISVGKMPGRMQLTQILMLEGMVVSICRLSNPCSLANDQRWPIDVTMGHGERMTGWNRKETYRDGISGVEELDGDCAELVQKLTRSGTA